MKPVRPASPPAAAAEEPPAPSWASLDETQPDPVEDRRLRHAYGRLFAEDDRDAEAVLADLTGRTIARCLGPGSTDAELRYLEGQRAIVQHILFQIQRGREP